MNETFRCYRLGQKPTFLFSDCLDFLTPGGAVAFVYVFTNWLNWSSEGHFFPTFFGFSESLGQNTPYIEVSRWDLWYSSFDKPKRKQTCRASTSKLSSLYSCHFTAKLWSQIVFRTIRAICRHLNQHSVTIGMAANGWNVLANQKRLNRQWNLKSHQIKKIRALFYINYPLFIIINWCYFFDIFTFW